MATFLIFASIMTILTSANSTRRKFQQNVTFPSRKNMNRSISKAKRKVFQIDSIKVSFEYKHRKLT